MEIYGFGVGLNLFYFWGCNSTVECVLCTYKVVGSNPTTSIIMAYILRTHLKKKYLLQGLTSVYGVGLSFSKTLCKRLGFTKSFLVKNMTEDQGARVAELVGELNYSIQGDLQRQNKQNLEDLLALKTYRGIRLRQGLPVRGQRTHTNAKTAKKFRHSKKLANS
jgi:small subunit ribosomal protein S13